MEHVACVLVGSCDRPLRVDARSESAREETCTHALDIESRDGAIASAQHAVLHVARVNGFSYDGPLRVDCEALRALANAGSRPRSIEPGDYTVLECAASRVARCLRPESFPRSRPCC